VKDVDMEAIFYTLQDFMTHTKAIAYLLIAVALIALPLYWLFLTGRDDNKRTY
jgi:hypothetical protein